MLLHGSEPVGESSLPRLHSFPVTPIRLWPNVDTLRVSRWKWLICGMVLFIIPGTMLSQHRGGRGGGARSGSTGVSDTETKEEKDFKRAAAIQARPEQVVQFQQLTKSDRAAQKSAQDLLRLAESASQPDLFHSTDSLTSAVDDAQSENLQFLQSLSDVQKSGLKDFTKKLGKAASEVTKENQALGRELERLKVDRKQIVEVAKRLDKALSDFQTHQVAIGNEMGIQMEGSSE